MTFIIRAALAVVLVSYLAACGEDGDEATTPGPQTAAPSAAPASSATSESQPITVSPATSDDPVITGEPTDTMPAALVAGQVLPDDGCIRLEVEDVGPVVAVWPHVTRWDAENDAIVLDDGQVVEIGDRIEGGGGFYSAASMGQIMPAVLGRVIACLPTGVNPETPDQVVLTFPETVTTGEKSTVGSEPSTALPSVAEPSEVRPEMGRDAFGSVLADLGVDVAGAPAGVLGSDEQVICGAEVLTQEDVMARRFNEPARRCFLDSHLAGVPAAFASSQPTIEGDPIISVWTTSLTNGVHGWLDSTRDAFGSGEWQAFGGCGRLTTNTPATLPRPPFEFMCAAASPISQPSQAPDNVPAEFRDRTLVPLCGYSIRIADVDEQERECFRTAVDAGQPAEFAYLSTGDEGEVLVSWFRSLGPGELEVFQMVPDLNGERITWSRSACTQIAFVDAPGFETDGLPIEADCRPL